MFSVNTSRGHPNPNATLNAFMAVGVAANWSSPMVINKAPLFLGGVLNGWEDPYFYFDLDLKKWLPRNHGQAERLHDLRQAHARDPQALRRLR